MSKDPALLAPFNQVAAELQKESLVSLGSGKKGFGSSVLHYGNKMFAMLSSKSSFVVKLPRGRVAELVASGHGEYFDPGHGRLMKEWFALYPKSDLSWLSLARESVEFMRVKSSNA